MTVGVSAIVATGASMAFFAGGASAASASLVGYGAGTTGGANASAKTVTSLSALTSAVSGNSAKVVRISGIISLSGQVKVGSNTTLVGVGNNSGLAGGGLVVKSVSNVIIQNLKISRAKGTDAITVQKATRIWIDHNDLSSDQSHGKDYYDGLVDITHAADYVTVSYNRFHNHYKVSLVGHSDDNGSEDTGHLRVTYYGNWFQNVNSRTPSIRFGKAHIFDNYFQNVTDSGVHSREKAQVLVQNNVFRNTPEPVTTTGDSDVDGYANLSGNDFGGGTNKITNTGSFTNPGYSYTLLPTASVITDVTTRSGVGIVG